MNAKSKIIILGVTLILLLGGVFFYLRNNKAIPSKIQKEDVSTSTIHPTPIPVATGTLFVTSDGLSPRQTVTVRKGETLKVDNNTLVKATIKTSGVFTEDITVDPMKKTATKSLDTVGEIKAWLSNNPENKVTIEVK